MTNSEKPTRTFRAPVARMSGGPLTSLETFQEKGIPKGPKIFRPALMFTLRDLKRFEVNRGGVGQWEVCNLAAEMQALAKEAWGPIFDIDRARKERMPAMRSRRRRDSAAHGSAHQPSIPSARLGSAPCQSP